MTEPENLNAQLANVCVGVRRDLHISRHVFRKEVWYIIQDPVTFQHYRLSPENYAVLMSIGDDAPLGQIFSDLVADERLDNEDENDFYRFVMLLHRMNFLSLPLVNDHALYERHVARQRTKLKQKVLGFLFLQIPALNPDALLERTVRYARPLFTRWCLAVWALLMTAVGVTIFKHGSELFQPINGMLSPGNLIWMWVALFGLKVVHEFGHAYACKHYGGHVPEMGLYFIVFAPCAYVDASASWNFERKRERLIVSLAGMYFESFIAAMALFVWVSTEPGFVNALAYNTFFLAGVVTLLFNINPLMRFDGYYVFSDLVEIPNLRQRATKYVHQVCKKAFLGLSVGSSQEPALERGVLFGYGLSSMAYRVLVVSGICMVVASRFFAFGIVLALLCVFMMALRPAGKLLGYLWFAEETAGVRGRAGMVTALALIGVPAAVGLVPVRVDVSAGGVVKPVQMQVVRAAEDGVVEMLPAGPGESVSAGRTLVRLENPIGRAALEATEAALRGARIRQSAYETYAPAKAQEEAERIHWLEGELAQHRETLSSLEIGAAFNGQIVEPVDGRHLHAYVQKGTVLAAVASDAREVRVLLTAGELERAEPVVGQRVEFRSRVRPDVCIPGRVEVVKPAGSRVLELTQLTHVGGGELAVGQAVKADGESWLATKPYFEVVVSLEGESAGGLPLGSRGEVRFGAKLAPIGVAVYRGAIRFLRSFAQS